MGEGVLCLTRLFEGNCEKINNLQCAINWLVLIIEDFGVTLAFHILWNLHVENMSTLYVN